MSWEDEAACAAAGVDPEWWFPEYVKSPECNEALRICNEECPVKDACQSWAIREYPLPPDNCVVGGLTNRQIVKIRKAQGIETPARLKLPNDMLGRPGRPKKDQE